MKLIVTLLLGVLVSLRCLASPPTDQDEIAADFAESTKTVVPVEMVEWEKLNPARGHQSPLAATLWGNRKGAVPTGFLARFVDGFSSPPHIHNVTYRAVVISGLIHNDDPGAARMWMPPGSFWTQPEGEVHITAAKGTANLALVEIDKGPYLVRPPEEATDTGERPINVEVSNIVWVDMSSEAPFPLGPQVAYLWSDPEGSGHQGTFVRLADGFAGELHSNGATFRAVVISGQLRYADSEAHTLNPGSYFGSEGDAVHSISQLQGEVTIYARSDGKYEILHQASGVQ